MSSNFHEHLQGVAKPANTCHEGLFLMFGTSGNITRVIIVSVNFSALSSIRNLTDRLTQA